MRNTSRILCVIGLASLMASCAKKQVVVPNIEFYGDKGKFGATKVESLHPEKPGVRLLKTPWDELRIGMVCTRADNITSLQAIIDKLCASNRTICYYAKDGVTEVQKALGAAERAAKE